MQDKLLMSIEHSKSTSYLFCCLILLLSEELKCNNTWAHKFETILMEGLKEIKDVALQLFSSLFTKCFKKGS